MGPALILGRWPAAERYRLLDDGERTMHCSFQFRIRWLPLACGLLLLGGCGGSEPFSFVKVSGKVTYDDGTPIPADPLVLTFFPEAPALDAKTFPRPGMGVADPQTGVFNSISSHRAGDGLIRGKHKVTLTALNRDPLPASVVPREYANVATTPLEVDTDVPDSFILTIPKPKPGAAKANAKGEK